MDPAEQILPAGRFPISDGERSAMLDTHQQNSRKKFDLMSIEHEEIPRRMFQRHKCGWMVLKTSDDPVDVLGRKLRMLVGRGV